MPDSLSKSKRIKKDVLVEQAIKRFGGRKSYYQIMSREELEALLNLEDVLVQSGFAKLVEQLSKSAKTNQKVNGRRLIAENKAERFEGHYKEELQYRTYIENQYYTVLNKLKQLIDVEDSEILKASRLALQVLKRMIND